MDSNEEPPVEYAPNTPWSIPPAPRPAPAAAQPARPASQPARPPSQPARPAIAEALTPPEPAEAPDAEPISAPPVSAPPVSAPPAPQPRALLEPPAASISPAAPAPHTGPAPFTAPAPAEPGTTWGPGDTMRWLAALAGTAPTPEAPAPTSPPPPPPDAGSVSPPGKRAIAGGWAPQPHPYQEVEADFGERTPNAEEFATRRRVRPRVVSAVAGARGAARRGSFGLLRLRPSRDESDLREALHTVRRNFGGLRQITVVNPKGGAGKTVATLMLGLAFGRSRGGFVLAWDNNETQGTLGMRAQSEPGARTVRDLLRDLDRFAGGAGRVGELAAYLRTQDDAMFDVLASDEAATAGEMLTARAFRELREVVGRFYKLLIVDTGNNVRAENWQAALDATDQLVITLSGRNDSAETAARLLDHLEQTGRRELVRRAVTVLTLPPHRGDVPPGRVAEHFAARCREVCQVPYDRHLDSGAPVDYRALSPATRAAWLRTAATIATGL
ncbi:chromosome partitioning protein [Luedemannella helvata]|uniref:MinD-like ATPase involved in chromosome partitioning or flagellar assembly n=1 Tax=Luedemannella helvata TaxID=349315 RepID=A0ABP4W9C7_9ACTN